MVISTYSKAEKIAITQLFEQVFSESEGLSEGAMVANLVADLIGGTEDHDILGFVAKDKEKIIGSIFFTRLVFAAPVEAFILSPVAVLTNCQGKGIGQQLINYGLEQLKKKNVGLVFTYGDPNFYAKVGFLWISEHVIAAPFDLSQPEGWLCQSLLEHEIAPISGRPHCVDALNNPDYW